MRVDSGGALNGALLRAGLVDELSLLVHPVLVGDAPRWYGSPPPGPLDAGAAGGRGAGLAPVSSRLAAGMHGMCAASWILLALIAAGCGGDDDRPVPNRTRDRLTGGDADARARAGGARA